MKKFAVLIALMLSCTDGERTEKVLYDQGYTGIKITGHSYSCSDSDTYCTAFTAVSPAGIQVSGAVGCGRSTGCDKGCTIRFN